MLGAIDWGAYWVKTAEDLAGGVFENRAGMNRKQLFIILKLAVVVAAVCWLRARVDFVGVGNILRNVHLGYLVLAVVFGWVPILISSFRWQTLLKPLGIVISLRALACVAQIGQFFAILVPGIAGDDGTRFFYISRLAPGRVKQACSTVLLDRVLGFASLFALTSICIPMNWSVMGSQPATRWVAVGFLSTGACVLFCGIGFLVIQTALLERMCSEIKSRFLKFPLVGELMDVAVTFARNRRSLCLVAGAALATQALICCGFWSAGRSVGIQYPLWGWMSFVPVILVANVLPVTFAGIGVRDYLLFLFLGSAAGASAQADQIAALSMLMLFSTFFLAAMGGLVYLVYKPPAKSVSKVEIPSELKV